MQLPRSISSTTKILRRQRLILPQATIYALFVIGHNWSEKTSGSRSDSALELFLNKSYYAIATTVETDLKLALSQIQVGQMLEAASVVGGGFARKQGTSGSARLPTF